jgi:phosphohistidine phosphatase
MGGVVYELLIARHGDAVDLGGKIASDADRPLSKRGEEEAVAIGRSLLKLDLCPEVILSSPLTRARQTAKRIQKTLEDSRCSPGLLECTELEPGATPPMFFKAIRQAANEKRILLVGHQPDVGRFLSFLISGGSMELQFAMKTGSVALVEIDEIPLQSPGRLLALMPPKLLDRI